ncbi:MAG TPA: hypothetical protein V6C85_22420 [Allocoleopsis sp.]
MYSSSPRVSQTTLENLPYVIIVAHDSILNACVKVQFVPWSVSNHLLLRQLVATVVVTRLRDYPD